MTPKIETRYETKKVKEVSVGPSWQRVKLTDCGFDHPAIGFINTISLHYGCSMLMTVRTPYRQKSKRHVAIDICARTALKSKFRLLSVLGTVYKLNTRDWRRPYRTGSGKKSPQINENTFSYCECCSRLHVDLKGRLLLTTCNTLQISLIIMKHDAINSLKYCNGLG